MTLRGTAVLAVAAAVATATSYVLQPELAAVAGDLGTSVAVVGVVAALPVVGYLLGLALLVPLADRVRSNRLVGAQLGVLGGGLALCAAAGSVAVLGAGLFVAGLCASTGAQLSSLAGRYSPPERRGRAVGTVTAGISTGIVLGRIVGGTLAEWVGWRLMLVVFAAACAALAAAAAATLPGTPLRAPESYPAVLASLPALLRSDHRLRRSAVAGSLWFFAFSLVWVALSVALAGPPLNLSPAAIGACALAGLLGVVATRFAGAAADRYGSTRVVLLGLALAATCTLAMTWALPSLPVLLAGMALFDAGLFAAQVANQSGVLALDPARPARLNSAYMVVYFVGGSAGTAVGGGLVELLGWPGATLVATTALIAAAAVTPAPRHHARHAAGCGVS